MTIHWHIETLQSVTSTQDLLKTRASEGAEQGLVIQAEEQSAGHGRHGREWISPKGNLYLSILLRPECMPTDIGQLSLVSSLAVQAAIPEETQLKWPNDVLLEGKKCAGLILETEMSDKIDWLALGIGINIASAPEVGTHIRAQSIGLNQLRDSLLKHLEQFYGLWQQGHFENIKEQWLAGAHPIGTKMEIKLGKSHEQGYFHGLDENGNLLLQGEDKTIQTVSAGDVYLR